MIKLAYPHLLWLLLLPFLFRWLLPAVKGLHGDALRIPFLQDLRRIAVKSGEIWSFDIPKNGKPTFVFVILYAVWALLCLAAARPLEIGEPVRTINQNRDILLVTDISNSMQERDFYLGQRSLSRLEAVKRVASDFIKKRRDDRVGLILFGSRAYLQAPVTFDRESVIDILQQTDAGMAGNSTSIGDALGLALKTFKDSPDRDKKVIILLTDGENNDGSISMSQAIDLAKAEKVKVYTIGVGSENNFLQAFIGMGGSVDEAGLKQIAKATRGTYFKAEDLRGLARIYDEIDALEPTDNDSRMVQNTRELYYYPLLAAILLAMLLTAGKRRIN